MARLSALDYLHRTVVYSLVGLTVWGVGMSVAVHRDTIRRGRGIMEQRRAAAEKQKEEELRELALAEQASSSLGGR